MKKLILVFLLLIPVFSFAQSKFSSAITFGAQWLGKDIGEFFQGSIGYRLPNDLQINLGAASSFMKNKLTDNKYQINKYGLFFNYGLLDKPLKFEPVFGLSYIQFKNNNLVERKEMMGVDIGVRTIFVLGKGIKTGVNVTATYAYYLPGSMIYAATFLNTLFREFSYNHDFHFWRIYPNSL